MSQKTNPVILRLGIKNSWISKYYAKKKYDFKNKSFNQLEVEKFIKLFLKKYKLKFKCCKIYYKKNSLHCFILYDSSEFNFKNFNRINNKLSTELVILKKFYNKFNFKLFNNSIYKLTKKNFKQNIKYTKFLYFFIKKNIKYKNYFNNYFKLIKYSEKKLKFNYLNLTNQFINYNILQRFYAFKFYFFLQVQKFTLNSIKNLFFKKFLIILKTFLKNQTNIFILLKQFNKNNSNNIISSKQKIKFIRNLTSLKKFQYYNFFEPGVNLLFNFLNNHSNSLNLAFLISNFITNELSKIKELKFLNLFLKFVFNKIKYFLITSKKVKGVEIKIKGNLNQSQRAVVKTIHVGKKIPKLLINNNLIYKDCVAYSKKGTFGVKTWIVLNDKHL